MVTRVEEFPVQRLFEEGGVEITKEEEEEDYLSTKLGDDKRCICQSELCYFRNIKTCNFDGGGRVNNFLRYNCRLMLIHSGRGIQVRKESFNMKYIVIVIKRENMDANGGL